MTASIKRKIRKTLVEIIEQKNATTAERLEACSLLWRDISSTQKGKPRGRPFTKRVTNQEKDSKERWERILSGFQ